MAGIARQFLSKVPIRRAVSKVTIHAPLFPARVPRESLSWHTRSSSVRWVSTRSGDENESRWENPSVDEAELESLWDKIDDESKDSWDSDDDDDDDEDGEEDCEEFDDAKSSEDEETETPWGIKGTESEESDAETDSSKDAMEYRDTGEIPSDKITSTTSTIIDGCFQTSAENADGEHESAAGKPFLEYVPEAEGEGMPSPKAREASHRREADAYLKAMKKEYDSRNLIQDELCLKVHQKLADLRPDPDGKFRKLIEVVSDIDVLLEAYRRVKAGPGGDPSKVDIKNMNMDWFYETQERLRNGTFEVKPMKIVEIERMHMTMRPNTKKP